VLPKPIRTQAREAIERAWSEAIRSGALPELEPDARPPIEVERPADPGHGDLATNLAMKLARPYRRAPLEIATLLAAKLVRDPGVEGRPSIVEAAEVAAPGFVNIRLRASALEGLVDGVLGDPASWGRDR
jgi:arginyl-tRNA synthetase